MKIIKFRIKHYKSIIDSGDCYLTNSVTILAGKNESGKTSILEALEDFDTEVEIKPEARPIKDKDVIPEISVTFDVEGNTLTKIFNEIGLDKNFTKNVYIEIIKYFPNQFTISDVTKEALNIENTTQLKEVQSIIEKELKEVQTIHKKYPQIGGSIPSADFENTSNFKTLVTQLKNQTTPNLAQISDTDEKEKFAQKIEIILENVTELENLSNIEKHFIDELKQYIPNFILFNSFEDIFPNKIPFAELEKNEWIKDLSIVSDLKIDTIKGIEDRDKTKHKDDVNIKLNDDYKKFWTQDISNLSIDWDSEHLYFWVKEDGYPYEPSLRSKGRQWHLAFYIKITARAKESVPNIILIDEPGLFLHAKAQRNILDKLENSAKAAQVIFSTHSPYLLEAEKLDRIRLIHRTKSTGTKIDNKIHALADKETLTPILTAIGLELNDGIQNIDKVKNIVVEGPSDVFYFQAFSKILTENNDLNYIFGGGAGNMPFVGTILQGWGCSVLYLYDNDQGKDDGEKNLTKNWLVNKELIESVLNEKGSVEDLFTENDFKNHVLGNEKTNYSSSNSEYLKKSKKDKVLISRLFLQKIENDEKINLEEQTFNNFKSVIEKIAEKFK